MGKNEQKQVGIGHVVIYLQDKPVELVCAGCGRKFKVHPEDERAMPGVDARLIYCDQCNEEAVRWSERIEAGWGQSKRDT